MKETKLYHPVVCFGETLWDIFPHARLPGGAPMNVAYHLNKLGKNPAIISRVGTDELGKELVHVFERKNIDTRYFQFDKEHPTGKVFAEIRGNNEVHYDIVKCSAWDFIQWESDFTPLIQQAEYFVFGSLVTRNKQSRNTLFKCIEVARTKVVDINLRPPHFNKRVVEQLLKTADILKLNLTELHFITGWFSDYNSDEDMIKLLKEKFDIKTVIVTKGSEGAVLNIDNSFYYHHGYTVTVEDTVGSGDSFLAAIIAKFDDLASPEEALDFASAVGAFIASRPGGCPDYKIQEVYNLMNKKKHS
jgi:fructokinase